MGSNKKRNSKNNKIIFWVISIIVTIIAGWMIVDQDSESVHNTTSSIIDYTNQPFLGDDNADINIVEFGDYKCPACKSFGENFVPLIQKDFINTGKVKFYFLNYDFINDDSSRAAEFAETVYQELGNELFWEFHELLYSNQPEDEHLDYFTEDKLIELLSEITDESNVEKVKNAFENSEGKNALQVDNEFVEQLNIQSTPTVYINDVQFTDGTYEDFSKMVNEALESE